MRKRSIHKRKKKDENSFSEEITMEEYIAQVAEAAEPPREYGWPWTRRGTVLPEDVELIKTIVDKNRKAARIFVTGEVAQEYIGKEATNMLAAINDVLYLNGAGGRPLFVLTRHDTVRMERFDPERVWRSFHPDTLVELVQCEIDRLGIDMDPYRLEHMDFYQSMITAIKAKYGDDITVMQTRSDLKDFYQGIYLSCLLLFGKPYYMAVPVAEHFSSQEAVEFLRRAGVFIQLSGAEREELAKLREQYGKIETLTNPEMHFVIDLYERTLKKE